MKNLTRRCFIGLLFVSVVALLASCATGYHANGFGGGYSEIITGSDSFIVTFRGNGYTSSEKVMKYSLRRAAELTIENGYTYFAVLSSADRTRSSFYSNTQGNANGAINTYKYSNSTNSHLNASGSSSTYSGVISKPGLTIEIKCFKKKPSGLEVIDAEYYLANNPD